MGLRPPTRTHKSRVSRPVCKMIDHVREVGKGAKAPLFLQRLSDADTAILLLNGEELIGAKQNRILNTDVLLRPHAKKIVPVSCVEQGWWRHTPRVLPSHIPGRDGAPSRQRTLGVSWLPGRV